MRNRVRVGLHGRLQATTTSFEDGECEIGGEGMRDNGKEEFDEGSEIPVRYILIGYCNSTQTLYIKVSMEKRRE